MSDDLSNYGVFIPPINVTLPRQPFEALLAQTGVRLAWMKSHTCPCTYRSAGPQGLPTPGSADPSCLTCYGVGVYWDEPVGPFAGLVTFMHMSPSPDEPGTITNPKWGQVVKEEPTVTIPYYTPPSAPIASMISSGAQARVFEEASTYDMFVELDARARFQAVLKADDTIFLPYQQNVVIAASGAVTTYDPVTRHVQPISGYVVSGASVTLPDGYPPGTTYVVEFMAASLYVAYRSAGGLPHVRPLGHGAMQLPKRFRAQALDIWTRQRQLGPGGATEYPAPEPANFNFPTYIQMG